MPLADRKNHRRLPSLPALTAMTAILALVGLAPAGAETTEIGPNRHFELQTVLTGVGTVVDLSHAGDDRLFLTAREGRIWILREGQLLSTPYLDIRDRVLFGGEASSEQGLLSVAFHPNYAANGYLFVAYTREDGVGIVSRFGVSGPNPDQASSGSERILFEVPQPGANHNLNSLVFGPDGYLYISSGDGGYQPEPRCTPQERDNLLGKILRVDVDASVDTPPYHVIPPTNPFVGDASTRDEIWALGLRNPWRFTFDPATDDLWLADVGQHKREEVNFAPAGTGAGRNWGFKMMEGFLCLGSSANCSEPIPPCFDPAYSNPIHDYGRNESRCAVIGGHVHRGPGEPELQGVYMAGDFCGATFLIHRDGEDFIVENLSVDLPGLVTFGVDAEGNSYLVADGILSRIVGLEDDAAFVLASASAQVSEGAGMATVTVERQNGTDGAASVRYETVTGSADEADFGTVTGVLSWADGEGEGKSFQVPIFDDNSLEGNERFRVVLSEPVGAALGNPSEEEWTIVDDDVASGPCVPSDTSLCLLGDRFQVTATWRDFEGATGTAQVVSLLPLGSDLDASGLLWFFTRDNMELLVKVLDACGVNGHRWVFFSAATSVEYTVRVLDTETGELRTYSNPLGTAASAETDIGAFACE